MIIILDLERLNNSIFFFLKSCFNRFILNAIEVETKTKTLQKNQKKRNFFCSFVFFFFLFYKIFPVDSFFDVLLMKFSLLKSLQAWLKCLNKIEWMKREKKNTSGVLNGNFFTKNSLKLVRNYLILIAVGAIQKGDTQVVIFFNYLAT